MKLTDVSAGHLGHATLELSKIDKDADPGLVHQVASQWRRLMTFDGVLVSELVDPARVIDDRDFQQKLLELFNDNPGMLQLGIGQKRIDLKLLMDAKPTVKLKYVYYGLKKQRLVAFYVFDITSNLNIVYDIMKIVTAKHYLASAIAYRFDVTYGSNTLDPTYTVDLTDIYT
jgi:hypothetical protein